MEVLQEMLICTGRECRQRSQSNVNLKTGSCPGPTTLSPLSGQIVLCRQLTVYGHFIRWTCSPICMERNKWIDTEWLTGDESGGLCGGWWGIVCMNGARSTCHNYTFITSIESATVIQLYLSADCDWNGFLQSGWNNDNQYITAASDQGVVCTRQ